MSWITKPAAASVVAADQIKKIELIFFSKSFVKKRVLPKRSKTYKILNNGNFDRLKFLTPDESFS